MLRAAAEKRLHFLLGRDAGDAAVLCGGQGCSSVGEPDDFRQPFRGKLFRRYARGEHLIHCRAPENISRAGGVDGFDLLEGGNLPAALTVNKITALLAHGGEHQLYPEVLHQLFRAVGRYGNTVL